MASALILQTDHVFQTYKFDAVTEVSLIMLQAEEKQRKDTTSSVAPSSSRSSSTIPAVASADERRPADEGQAHLQAQPQVHSHVCVLLLPTTASVLYFPGST